MAIATVVTRGFGNGTYEGTIALVVTRGYSIGEEPEAPAYVPPMVSTTGGARRPLARAAGGPRGRIS
jgi:hypothetical protein